ncbi:MAG: hypothetical protein ACI4JQ_04610, partial [Ruminococcus sp.]
MIQLTAQDKMIDTSPIERLFTEGEKYADRIHITLPQYNNDVDVSGCTFVMRTVAKDGSMTETVLQKQLTASQILLTWDVPETVTAVPGMLLLELVGTQESSTIIKYKMQAVFVKEAVMGEGLPSPDVMEEKLAQMNEILAQAQEKLDEAKNLAIGIDTTLTIAGQAADAKAVGDKLDVLGQETNDKLVALEQSVRDISGSLSDGAIQEVVDARTATAWNGHTYGSLSDRLTAEFSSKISQGTFEIALADTSTKIAECKNTGETNAENITTNASAISAAQTDIAALKATVKKLQDEDVSISKNVSATNATATAAYNKATSALEAKHTHDNLNVLDTITSDTIALINSTASKATQNANSLDAIKPIVTGNQTDITALKASVQNLQDEDVNISKNVASVKAAAETASNKAATLRNDMTIMQCTIGTAHKNLLKNTAGTVTQNGITFTSNADGSVTCNGTATADTNYRYIVDLQQNT